MSSNTPDTTPATGMRHDAGLNLSPGGDGSATGGVGGLSYKFQRLRERLRESVTTGELAGKLPGERTLAKRFQVNAKTLSKALTDLAAEGLLDRSIGRGTYVKSATTSGDGVSKIEHTLGQWLVVCEADRVDSPAVRAFVALNPAATVIHDVSVVRPSFLKQFDAVVDFGRSTPEVFVRGLVVRNMPVVTANREPAAFSLNGVAPDRALGGAELTRDLAMAGHVRFAVVEAMSRGAVAHAVRIAADRYAAGVTVATCGVDGVVDAAREATAVICDCVVTARRVRDALDAAGVRVPADVSLAAVGCSDDPGAPCSGHYADPALLAQTVSDLLSTGLPRRPATIWLATRWRDRGTTGRPRAST
jgi:DNA-binding HxlR family transcriptional regulator